MAAQDKQSNTTDAATTDQTSYDTITVTTPEHHFNSLETAIRRRHSIRFYKPEPVPRELLHECMRLAELASSDSNIQNWRLTLASEGARERAVPALKAASTKGAPQVAPLPGYLRHFRSEFGHLLYGEAGHDIRREERERHKWAQMRNFEFFGAPVAGVIAMDGSLTHVDTVSVGTFVQTFMMALTEWGLGSCSQVRRVPVANVLNVTT